MNRCAPLFLALLLASCANPKYASSDPLAGTDQGTRLSCQARFRAGPCVSIAWEKLPTEEEFGSFVFTVFREGATPAPEDLPNVSVVLWMPSMGHGSSPVTVTRLDTGTYRASSVFFTMGGDWEIRFQVKAGSNVQDQANLPLRF